MKELGHSFKVHVNGHPLRKNNGVVNTMYALYLDGRSLAAIGKIYGKTRQAIYDMFRSRGYELRHKPLKGLMIIDGFQFTETKGGYLRGTVSGRRILAHQYVWEKANGAIPADVVLHFKDNDPKNITIDNLEIVSKKLMFTKFNAEKKGCWGSEKSFKHTSLRERVRAEREARWKKAMAIGK